MSEEKKIEVIDPEALEAIKKDLLARKEQLEKDLRDISEGNSNNHRVKFPEYGDKPDENAQEIGEYDTNLATDYLLEKSLRDVENALKRIEEGTYGTCKYCGKSINPKRLQARPVASACIECKTKLQSQG
jgi:RNA polymerase-binding protein DksA